MSIVFVDPLATLDVFGQQLVSDTGALPNEVFLYKYEPIECHSFCQLQTEKRRSVLKATSFFYILFICTLEERCPYHFYSAPPSGTTAPSYVLCIKSLIVSECNTPTSVLNAS